MSSLNRAIVHHTAGGEFNTTGLEDSKADVRGIQNLHMDANGWSDIGYHFLVDKFGHIFEGRYASMGGLPKGAHDGTNSNSFGFNVMGYFHTPYNNIPTSAMMNALYDVIAWRMPNGWQPYGSPGTYGPLGNWVGYVDSHRRVKSTACPGDHVHNPYIGNDVNAGTIRAEIKKRIDGIRSKLRSDFNGDGKDDIVTFTRGTTGDVWVALSSGGGFNAGGGLWHDNACYGEKVPLTGDFNGDGKSDMVVFTRGSAGEVWVSTSSGSYFYPAARWHDWFAPYEEYPLVGDFNGDGKDDIITFTRGTTGDVWVGISTGSSFKGAGSGLWHGSFCFENRIPVVGDFNGDGKDDIAGFTRSDTGDVWVSTSSGSGFYPAAKWHDWFAPFNEVPSVGDFNGDGKDDIVTFTRGSTGDVWVSTSSGTGFYPAAKWHDWFAIGDEIPGCLDANGDGKTDIVTFTRTDRADVLVSTSSGSFFYGAGLWHDTFCYWSEFPRPSALFPSGDFSKP